MEPYTVGEPETIQAGLKAALKAKPDLIVFPGRAREVNVLLNDTNMPMTGLILGGSALYEVGEYNGNANTRFQLLRFTSPAYPDEWSVLGHQQQMPAFFKEYSQVFDPDGVHSIRPYGYSRPTAEVMLAFDAMSLLLNAGRGNFTVESILSGLRHTMGSQAWPGVAGSIAFKLASSHELSNKTVLLLWVDKNGNIQMLLPKGRVCFLAADCTYENNNDGIIYMKTHLFSVLNSLIKGITISHNFSSLPARSCHNTFRHNCKANVRKTLVGRQRA